MAARVNARRAWMSGKAMLGTGLALLVGLGLTSVLYVLPGDGLPLGPGGMLALGLGLGLALRMLHHPPRDSAQAWRLQAPAALGAAAAAAGASWRAPSATTSPALDPALPPMVALCTLAWLLVAALRAARRQRVSAGSASAAATQDLDPLTRLPNRSALESQLALRTDGRGSRRRRFALMLINLDGFMAVNASYGHAVGDQLLRHVGRRLRRHLRPRDFLARLAADEFAVLRDLRDDDTTPPQQAAETLLAALAQPMRIEQHEINVSASIGIAQFPEHGAPDRLLARGDAAMRHAKRAGGARAVLFAAEMEADLADDLELLRDLRRALQDNGFELAFQPKIDAASGQVTAAEALLRWRHATRGDIAPSVFVALAERFGLVGKLGEWVIENACRQARQWADHGLKMRVAINLSAQHMRDPELAERIRRALVRYGIEPSRLTCEITESLAMENTAATQHTFAQLGAVGVHLSIDDFGTGYSSLAYLRALPASEIKIDRSFVMDLERSGDARAVVKAVVKLAHALGKRVVAEGVETMSQRRILTDMGCDELQGYLFARPMAAGDLLAWALDARNQDEQAFRQSLYSPPDSQARRAIDAARESSKRVS
jgi:diguanylate cyclase (GGDEF)-like protein